MLKSFPIHFIQCLPKNFLNSQTRNDKYLKPENMKQEPH